MTTLFAQPYDISANGFYFDSFEAYERNASILRNSHGDPVEEFEIQFIDGDDIDCDLANAWGLSQISIRSFFEAVEGWEHHQKIVFIIAVGECGYSFNPDRDNPDDFDVDIYQADSLKELAEQFVDDGLYGPIPESLAYYIDYDAIARDLSVDFTETTIAGERLVYACR